MKIKHWQGYGSVNAQKTSMTTSNGITKLCIHVTGNHEYGIHLEDSYDLFNWLVRKFDKKYTSFAEWNAAYPSISIIDGYDNDLETCDYTFTYQSQT